MRLNTEEKVKCKYQVFEPCPNMGKPSRERCPKCFYASLFRRLVSLYMCLWMSDINIPLRTNQKIDRVFRTSMKINEAFLEWMKEFYPDEFDRFKARMGALKHGTKQLVI